MELNLKTIYKSTFSESFRIKITNFKRHLKGLSLKGNNVACNCCGKTFTKFLPKGNGLEIRENAVCPNCGSLERTRLLLFYLQNETDIFKRNCKLLHIAPEDTLKKIFKAHSNIYYVNGDLNPNYADEIIDMTNIQYPENNFDFVICSHVLGHIPDEKKAIQEMFRVLKPGGIAFVLTLLNKEDIPTIEDENIKSDAERVKIYGEKDLVRLHGNDFAVRLHAGQFSVEKIDYTKQLSSEIVEKYKLLNTRRGIIFKCTRVKN